MERDAGRRVFGTDARGYAQGRPHYPSRVYEILETTCLLRSDSTVFEIGAGTGQATEQLLARAGSVDAIEPDHRLAALLEERLQSHASRLRLHSTVFEEVALPPAVFDLGVAAMSFHWVAAEPALRKVFHLLKPGGHWAMWWTVFGNPNDPDDFQRATQALFSALERSPSQGEADGPPFALDSARRTAEMQRAGLEDVTFETILWNIAMNRKQTMALTATFSPVARLPDGKRRDFLDRIGEVVDTSFAGLVHRTFITAIYTARKPSRGR